MKTNIARLLKILGGALVVIVIAGLLFPAVSLEPRHQGRSETKSGVGQVTAALKQYYIEYGKWPDFTGDGLFLDATRNARLMRMLRAQDEVNNPRKIVFFEGRIARKSKAFSDRVGGGLDPKINAFLDTWGNPYHIIVDADYDGQISSPYSQDADPTIRTVVIVWSSGKDGNQGAASDPLSFRGSDDILSWQ